MRRRAMFPMPAMRFFPSPMFAFRFPSDPSDSCGPPPDQTPVPATISSRGQVVRRSQPASVTRIVSENPKSRART